MTLMEHISLDYFLIRHLMFLNRVCRKFTKFGASNSMFINELLKLENVHIFIFLAVLWYFIYARP